MNKWIIGVVVALVAVLTLSSYSGEGEPVTKIKTIVEVVRIVTSGDNCGYGGSCVKKMVPTNSPRLQPQMEGAAFATRRWDVIQKSNPPRAKAKRKGKGKKTKAPVEPEDQDEPEDQVDPDIISAGKIQILPPSKPNEEGAEWELFFRAGELDEDDKTVVNEVVKGNVLQVRFDDEPEDMFHQRLMTLLHIRVTKPKEYKKYQDMRLEELEESQKESFLDLVAKQF